MTFLMLSLGPSLNGEVLKFDDNINPFYEACVAWGINHPLKNHKFSGELEYSGNYLDFLNNFCHCKSVADKNEKIKASSQKLGYFFMGRESYFSKIDVCLQESEPSNYFGLVYGMLIYDQLNPIISSILNEQAHKGIRKIIGREVANSHLDCLQNTLIKECNNINSLFFTYKCIKKRTRDLKFLEEIKKRCHSQETFKGNFI